MNPQNQTGKPDAQRGNKVEQNPKREARPGEKPQTPGSQPRPSSLPQDR